MRPRPGHVEERLPRGLQTVYAVSRFAASPPSQTRDIAEFDRYSDWIFHNPHDAEDEKEWLKRQGPWSPGLIEYLKKHVKQYEALIFYSYLYAPDRARTANRSGPQHPGARCARRAADSLKSTRTCSASRRRSDTSASPSGGLSGRRSIGSAVIEETIGCGVDLPPHHAYPRAPGQPGQPSDQSPGSEPPHRSQTMRSAARVAGFLRMSRPAARVSSDGIASTVRSRCMAGRIDPGKGCEELIEYFSSYVSQGGDASLVLMGLKLMPLPEEPFINFAGMLSEQERLQALEAATVVVCPSPYESLSLIALEALAVGTPILCNARSDVLVDHCLRSNGGLFYRDRDEFVEALKLLVSDERLRAAMGRTGREYVRRNYRWDVVLGKIDRMIARLRS